MEFAAKPTKECPYTSENWNAVILWNLLAKTISGDDKYAKDGFYLGSKGSDDVVEKVGTLIIRKYKGS